ncbi:hypothetical protein KIF53_09495 [Chromobacterium subtsugae]|uniref:Uncharacterized protein n=1 Tax=Chromobacterium subtsugae TaxID=251747 RepID=A0ABS7FCX8_9NEIS|nr:MULTISPECIES: hypothetical protein [Chromobacterium]MBW7566284.1 hypothetical protein [Chromobacterium subtsugae]MBW8287857.1 hypothetical protein [Chromobacterium subtsugae]WSE91186.1 hypothetical protein U6115_20280 [Chromobacterium subtsugae]WVH59561.1 hypothetical protein U6151_20310 [Chromobacterium subtsugae]
MIECEVVNQKVDVVSVVRKALEVLSAVGGKAIDYGKQSGGGEFAGAAVMDYEAAVAINLAMIELKPEWNLALMWKVLSNDPRDGWVVCQDLACFASNHLGPSGDKFGRDGLLYWVRHWARRDGSSREAAWKFGHGYDTHQRYYRETVEPLLSGWFIAAKGKLEPVIACYFENLVEAA